MKYLDFIKQEMAVIMDRDPAIKSKMEVFLYPSFWALLKYRKAHKLYKKGHFYRARKLSQRTARKTGIEIHPGATIGEGLFIDHGHGVVIGETAIIGDNVTLYQGVSLDKQNVVSEEVDVEPGDCKCRNFLRRVFFL